MAKAVDKVVLTNIGALTNKYGSKGLRDIQSAVSALIAADKARGLETRIIALDDSGAMSKLSAPPVTKTHDPKQNKLAIDAIYKALTPDYIVLLGSIDVIPHQDLKNPLYSGPTGDDPDQFAYGDIPYACDAPYSQTPQDFVGPTRVVGRLPDITAGTDPSYLVKVLGVAAGYKPVKQQAFMNYFAVTAQIWEASTKLSVTNIFSNAKDLMDVPPNKDTWDPGHISRLSHFFNCHGADTSSQFYGQPKSGARSYPVALDAAYVDGKLKEGSVLAAECCYGGQLYATSQTQPQVGILNTYLANRCYGFFASTTIAYGPSKGNGQADLICQNFMIMVSTGASLGRAALQARQRFVRSASPPDPSDLKTLAQFNLYGDPSITPVEVAQAGVSPSESKSKAVFSADRLERRDRRRQLFRQGVMIADTEPVPKRSRSKTPLGIARTLRAQMGEFGLESGTMLSFSLQYPQRSKSLLPRTLMSGPELPTAYHVLFAKSPESKQFEANEATPHVVSIAALVGKEVNGKIVSSSMIYSR
jgi:hypothetical protein